MRSRSLWALFTLNLGERFASCFSFAILSQYLDVHLNLAAAEAGSLLHSFTWWPYAFMLLGAMVADRWLGHRWSAMKAGAKAWMVKPFKRELLLMAVKKLTAQRP